MATLTLQSNRSAFADSMHPTTNDSTSTKVTFSNGLLYVGFDGSTLSSISGKAITKAEATVTCIADDSSVRVYPVSGEWDETTLTYYSRPSYYNGYYFSGSGASVVSERAVTASTTNAFTINTALQYGVLLTSQWFRSAYTSRGGANAPTLTLTYENRAPTRVIQSVSPTSGYVEKNKNKKFSWSSALTEACVGTVTTTSVFRWRPTGGTATSVNVGANNSYTLAGSSITADSIQWQVEVSDSLGNTVTSSWYTLSTIDSTTTATAVSPSNTIEDAPFTFTWTTANPNGTTPTGADLQYSTDGTTWTTFGTVTGSATTYTASSGIPGGTVQWRVRAKNADGVAGPWSSALSFVSIAAPAAPVVNYDGTPLSTVSWQGTGQVAYEVRIDGVLVKGGFGSVMSYTLEEPLSDGEHVIAVRIQSSLGLWSENGLSTFIVQNAPGTAVTLDGAFGIDASLAWTGDGIVYRDGVKIGTGNGSYVDRLALGEHSYYVIVPTGDGNYTQSNTVTGLTVVERAVIDLANNPRGWMQLRLTQNSDDLQAYTYTRASQQFHITATALPVIEISKYEDESVTLNTAFTDPAEIEAFEALRGQVVIVKARGNNVIVGGMVEVQKEVGDFFTNFSFTINRIHWEGV